MNKFKVGDKVIALNSKSCKYSPRTEGEMYTVIATHTCRECGDEWICIHDINLGRTRSIKCSQCGFDKMQSNSPFVSTRHFALVEQIESKEILLIKLNNAIQSENYEEAAKLRDKINIL